MRVNRWNRGAAGCGADGEIGDDVVSRVACWSPARPIRPTLTVVRPRNRQATVTTNRMTGSRESDGGYGRRSAVGLARNSARSTPWVSSTAGSVTIALTLVVVR